MKSTKKKPLLLVAAAVALGAAALGVQAGPGPSWTALAPVPSVGCGVEGMSVAQIDGHIMAALGYDRGAGDTNRLRIYDITANTWSFGANAPGPSSEGAGIAHGGLFYAVGGRFGAARTDIWAYDPDTDTWDATLAPMSQGRAGLALATVGNAIYAIGGRIATGGPCTGGELASVERYDIDTDTWTNVAPLPNARSDLAAATVGGKIYVFGGCTGFGTYLNSVSVYDPTTDTWTDGLAAMPTARAAMYSVATKGDTVYVIGGSQGVFPGVSANEAYTVSKNAWTTAMSMPTPRGEAGAAGHGGRIYVLGGSQPAYGNAVAANEVFKP